LLLQLFADAWLLDIENWQWIQIKIDGGIYEPPDLWCHASVLVDQDVIVFSEEKKCNFCGFPVQNYDIPERSLDGKSDGKSCTEKI